MTRTPLCQVARLALVTLLVLPLYGISSCGPKCGTAPACQVYSAASSSCVASPQPDGNPCVLTGTNNAWCIDGACIPNRCFGVDCDDGNDCTVNQCDPATGLCLPPEERPGFLECNLAAGGSGICVGTECRDDPCLRPSLNRLSRINCCVTAACGSDWATTCLPLGSMNGDTCDPTGEYPPGYVDPDTGLPVQQNGVCEYDAANDESQCVWEVGSGGGACEGVGCVDDGKDCTWTWCDPIASLPLPPIHVGRTSRFRPAPTARLEACAIRWMVEAVPRTASAGSAGSA